MLKSYLYLVIEALCTSIGAWFLLLNRLSEFQLVHFSYFLTFIISFRLDSMFAWLQHAQRNQSAQQLKQKLQNVLARFQLIIPYRFPFNILQSCYFLWESASYILVAWTPLFLLSWIRKRNMQPTIKFAQGFWIRSEFAEPLTT